MDIGFTHKAVAHLLAAILVGTTEIKVHLTEYGQVLSVADGDVYLMMRGTVNRELIKVDVSASEWGSSLTIARGQGGTTARDWPVGTVLFATTHADHYNSIIQAGENRTIDYNPNEVLTPLYAGEKVYQDAPAGCERWWKSYNGVNPYWDIITGEPCSFEGYEDIGWDYDLLILGDPWSLKKSLYDVNSSLRWPYALAYNSADHTLFVGTKYLCNIWKSDDGGATWTLNKDLSASDEAVYSLVYDSNSDVLVAGTDNAGGIWRSTDGGDNWSYVQRLGSELKVKSMVFDSNSNVIIAGTGVNAQLYKSDDAGASWTLKKDLSLEPNAEDYVLSLTFDSSRNRIIAGTGLGEAEIWVSTDAGETWVKKKELGLESPAQSRVLSLVYDAANDVIVAGTWPDGQIWASGDGGENWTLKKDLSNESPGQPLIEAMGYNSDNGWLFAGTGYNAQLWVSKDGGDTWTLDQSLGASLYAIYSLAYDPYHNRMVAGIGNNFGSPGAQIWTRGNT
jgi:photosystem II stability/assembly factor-like uncharacterized protein